MRILGRIGLFIAALLSFSFSVQAQDSQDSGGATPSYPPNRIETKPTPPPKRVGVVAVPQPGHGPGSSSLDPGNASQMGAGLQIHFGGAKKSLEEEKQLEEKEDND